jgi:hypothetical protein
MRITERELDVILDAFEKGEHRPEDIFQDFGKVQPSLYAFLIDEQAKYLTKSEQSFYTFLISVIWKCIPSHLDIHEDWISQYEEENWHTLDAVKSKKFSDKITPFFERCPEEELLAFIEDSLAEDEELMISQVSKEWIFISLMTMIDCLLDKSKH